MAASRAATLRLSAVGCRLSATILHRLLFKHIFSLQRRLHLRKMLSI